MAISKLRAENFKGIRELTEFEIKPITLFIGPNSSGKSSCIHALAALAQTSKLLSSGRPLVLDDEYAQVHLGRFIEVIHSKSYSDPISIGFEAQDITSLIASSSGSTRLSPGKPIAADYSFKSTRRTQDVYLDKLAYRAPNTTLLVERRQAGKYAVEYNAQPLKGVCSYDKSLNVSLGLDTDSSLDAFLFNESFKKVVAEQLGKVLYLGPFRQSPLRRYPTFGANPTEVGAQGENAITLLANEFVQTKARPNLRQISSWLHGMGLARSVELARVGNSDLFDVSVTLEDGVSLPIADLGYGMSQVLPVLAQCTFAPEKATLLFEQPELHLNHTAAKNLSHVLVDAALQKNLHVIAETHSRELFFGVLDAIREQRITPEQVAIYTVRREDRSSRFTRIPIEVDTDGKPEIYDPWDSDL